MDNETLDYITGMKGFKPPEPTIAVHDPSQDEGRADKGGYDKKIPDQNAPSLPLLDKGLTARKEGFGWDEQADFLKEKTQQALAEGFTEKEVHNFLGFDPNVKGAFQGAIADSVATKTRYQLAHDPLVQAATGYKASRDTVSDIVTGGVAGAMNSPVGVRTGALLGQDPKNIPEMPGPGDRPMKRVAATATSFIADWPYYAVTAAAGFATGGPWGAAVGGYVGGSGLVAADRRWIMDGQADGKFSGPGHAIEKLTDAATEGAKGAAVGVAGLGGEVVGGPVGSFIAMQAAQAAVDQRVPTLEEVATQAMLGLGMHYMTPGELRSQSNAPVHTVIRNMMDWYKRTGVVPQDTRSMMDQYPEFAQKMQAWDGNDKHAPAASSITLDQDGDTYTVPREHVEQTRNIDGFTPMNERETPYAPPRKGTSLATVGAPDSDFTKWNKTRPAVGTETTQPNTHELTTHDLSGSAEFHGTPMTEVKGLIIHHTGGTGTAAGVIATLNQRGLGINYVIDRDGQIWRGGKEGDSAAHILPGWGKGEGLNNHNSVGIEVIARDDSDVTPAQIEAGRKFGIAFMREHPGVQVFGHGEVNAGHKQATEGLTIANSIRSEKDNPAAKGTPAGSTFDDAARRTLSLEGSTLAHDSGGKSIYGISQKYHRDVWDPETHPNGPSKEEAVRIYHDEYWTPLKIDEMPPNMRGQALDAAILHGVPAAKKMIAAAGNDPHILQKLREDYVRERVRNNPDEAGNLNGWLRRIHSAGEGAEAIVSGDHSHIPEMATGQWQDSHDPHTLANPPKDTAWDHFNNRPIAEREEDLGLQRMKLQNEKGAIPEEHRDLGAVIDTATDPVWGKDPTKAVEMANDMRRGDITQVMVDRARTEAEDKAKEAKDTEESFLRKHPVIDGMPETPLPASILNMHKLAEEREKQADHFEKLTGQKPSARANRERLFEEIPSLIPQEHPLVRAAQTQDPVINAVLNHSDVAKVIANAKVVRDFDVPYFASGSMPFDNPIVFIDKNAPKTLTFEGNKLKVDELMTLHENVEQWVMEHLIKEHGWSHDDAYKVAHYGFAEVIEHAAVARMIGQDTPLTPAQIAAYEKLYEPFINQDVKENANFPPKAQAYRDQYPEGSMQQAHLHGDAESEPSPELLQKAKELIAGAVDIKGAGTSGRGRNTHRGQATPINPTTPPFQGNFNEALNAVAARIGDLPPAQRLGEILKGTGQRLYFELFDDKHAMRRMRNIVAGIREANGQNPMSLLVDPVMMMRAAEVWPSTVPEFMTETGGVHFHRDQNTGEIFPELRTTGTPGLLDIVGQASFTGEFQGERDNLPRGAEGSRQFGIYLASKWAQEKRASNFPDMWSDIGPQLERVAQEFEQGARNMTPERTPEQIARDLGINIEHYPPDANVIQGGPHYQGRSPLMPYRAIRMQEPLIFDYEQAYGKGTTYTNVLIHELGHGIMDEIGSIGTRIISHPQRTALADEAGVISRILKPGFWKQYRNRPSQGQGQYMQTDQEIWADMAGVWSQHPELRHKMPTFQAMFPAIENFGRNPGNDWGTPAMRRADQFHTLADESLKLLRDSGMMSNEGFLLSLAENQARVPGYRDHEDMLARDELNGRLPTGPNGQPMGGKTVRGGSAGLQASNPLHAFQGSNLDLAHIYASSIADFHTRVVAAARNMFGQRFVTMMLEHLPDEIEEIEPQWVGKTLTDAQMQQVGMGGKINPKVFNPKLWSKEMTHENPNTEMTVWFNGVPRRFKFKDPTIVPCIKAIGNDGITTTVQLLAKIEKFTRAGIARYPLFPIRQGILDTFYQPLINPDSRGMGDVIQNFVVGVLEHFMPNPNIPEHAFELSAAAQGIRAHMSIDNFIKETVKEDIMGNTVPNTTRNGLDLHRWWDSFRQFSDSWARGAVMLQKRGRFARGMLGQQDQSLLGPAMSGKAGPESALEAGVKAADTAFHKPEVGGKAVKGSVNKVVPFSQAHFQTLNALAHQLIGQRLYGSMFNRPNLNDTGKPFSPAQWFKRGTTLITLYALASWWMNKDEPWYIAQPQMMKDNGFFLPGFLSHVYVKLPYGIGPIFAGLPVRLAQHALHMATGEDSGHGGFNLSDIVSSGLYAMVPPGAGFVASALMTTKELQANYSYWADRPIVTDAEAKDKFAFRQFSPYTSQIMKSVTEHMYNWLGYDMSPAKLDYAVNGYLGQSGEAIVKLADLVLGKLGVINEKGFGWNIDDIPGVGAFHAKYPRYNAQPVVDYFERERNRLHVAGTIESSMTDNDLDAVAAIAKNNPIDAALANYKFSKEQRMEAGSSGATKESGIIAQHILENASIGIDKADVQKLANVHVAIDSAYKVLRGLEKSAEHAKPSLPLTPAMIKQLHLPQDLPLVANNINDRVQWRDNFNIAIQEFAQEGNRLEHKMDADHAAAVKGKGINVTFPNAAPGGPLDQPFNQ